MMIRRAGFTLIEILTALAILSISFAAITAALTQAGNGIAKSERRLAAVSMAQNLLAETTAAIENNRLSDLPVDGESTAGLIWRRQVGPARPIDNVADKLARYRIEIEVSPGDDGRPVRLESFYLKAGPRS